MPSRPLLLKCQLWSKDFAHKPPLCQPRLKNFSSSATKILVSSNTTSTRGHKKKFVAIPRASSTYRPQQPYLTRLQSHLQKYSRVASSSPFKFLAKTDFVQSFWNSPRHRSDSLVLKISFYEMFIYVLLLSICSLRICESYQTAKSERALKVFWWGQLTSDLFSSTLIIRQINKADDDK